MSPPNSRFHEHLPSDHDSGVPSPLPSPPPQARSRPNNADVIAQIRAATTAPTPLIELLKDPAFVNALDHADGKRSHRQSSSSRHREPRYSSSTVMGLLLAEEQNQSHQLRSLLRSTGDRLDQETRRANQAESKADFAERRVLELTARVSAAEMGKHYAELDASRANEEAKRYQMRIECLERELKQLQADIRTIEKQRDEADASATRARDTARKFQIELAKQQAIDEGLEQSSKKWFITGHAEGFDDGREDGFEEGRQHGIREGRELGFKQGRKSGRKEGFESGHEQGRREEHERALLAFDEFFAAEFDEDDYKVSIDMPSLIFHH